MKPTPAHMGTALFKGIWSTCLLSFRGMAKDAVISKLRGNGVSIRLEQPIGCVSGCWNHAGTHMALWAEEASTLTCRYNMKV